MTSTGAEMHEQHTADSVLCETRLAGELRKAHGVL